MKWWSGVSLGLLVIGACKAEVPTEVEPCSLISGFVDRDGDGFGDPTQQSSSCALPVVDDGTDCDDSTATANPDAEEICDGLDNDCDGLVDLDDTVDAPLYFMDRDGDGYGAGEGQQFCTPPEDSATVEGDCDDTDPDITPANIEICDGVDNNCDGLVDDDDPATENVPVWFLDEDMDGFPGGNIAVSCLQPPFSGEAIADCDDGDAERYPDAIEICDNADQNCDNGLDNEMFGFDVCGSFEGAWEGSWSGTFVGPETVACPGTATLTLDRSLSPPVQGTFSCTLSSNPAGWDAVQTGSITGRFKADGTVEGEAMALDGQLFDFSGTVFSEASLTGAGSGLLVGLETWDVDFDFALTWDPFQ